MLSRWKKTDIFLALVFLLTILSFFLLPSTVFKLLLWSFIVIASIRFYYLVKRKLLWKIRNRLIFSGLFLVATPILFISIIMYFVGSAVVAQYGSLIIGNVLNERLSKLEPYASSYIRSKNAKVVYVTMKGYLHSELTPFMINFWEYNDEHYQPFYKSHPEFNEKKIVIEEFSGYFLVEDQLYLGMLRKNEKLAVLLAYELNQQFLDDFSSISEFRMIYKTPEPYIRQEQREEMQTLGMTVDSSSSIIEEPIEEEQTTDSITPALFSFTFYDFNTIIDSMPIKRQGHFVLSIDFKKIYSKIVNAISSPAHANTKQFLIAIIVPVLSLIIASLIIGFRMVRVITKSINQLTKGTQRIRNGDFSFRIKTRSGDQLQYLADSFNEMAQGIDRLLVEEKEKQRLEEELRIARSIQLKLLPADSFFTDHMEIAAVNIPAAEIAGDYFDYFYEKDKSLAMLVADVSGKGASAAFYMAELKGVINHLQREVMSPSALISECHYSLKQSFDRITFITMNLAYMNIREQKFILARAGHTPALYYCAEKKRCTELFPEGMAIGLINFSKEKIKEIEVQYKSGDILFLFSDGLSEIMNQEDEMLGVNNLRRILRDNHHLSAEEIKQRILDFSIKFSDSGVNRDDLTFIILKVK